MKVAVIGSQNFTDFEFLKSILQYHPCTQIISGGAKGTDMLAKQYAAENGLPIKEFLPNWNKYGKSAGYQRDQQIVKACDELVVFDDDKSKRIAHSIQIAEQIGKPVYIYCPPKKDIEF